MHIRTQILMFKKTIRKNLSRLGFRFGFHTTIQVKNEKE